MSIVDRSFSKMIKAGLLLSALLGSVAGQAQRSFSLKECIAYGVTNHPSVTVARNNVENAHQASREALAGYLPQVNINSELNNNLKLQTNIIPASPPLFPTETKLAFGNKFSSTVVAQADQPIYNQSLITGLKANKPNQEIARLTEAQNRQTLIYNIATAYYQVITIQKQLELFTGNKARISKLLKVAQLQADAGVAKKVDVKQVQVNLNNVSAQLSVAENNLQLAYNTLKNAMGDFTNDTLLLTDTVRWLHYRPQIGELPEFRSVQTLDYRLQEQQIRLYDLNARSIRAGSLPTLSVFARYGLNGFGSEFEKVFNRQFDYSTVGVKLSWSLFDGFRRNAQYQQAIFERDNAKLNLEINNAGQRLQYQNAGSQYRQAQSTLVTNQQNVELAAQVYDNTSLQYKEGAGSMSDLLNAESSYRDAQNNYIQSLISFYLARLDLERANSSLDDFFNQL